MTKEELKKALEDAGVKVDGRWNEAKLQTKYDELTTVTITEENVAGVFEKVNETLAAHSLEKDGVLLATSEGFVAVENVDTAPTYSEKEIEAIAEDLSGKNIRPIEELKAKVQRNDAGQLETASGLLIPDSVFGARTKTGWSYRLRNIHNACVVERMMYTGLVEFVREFSLSIHGNGYAALAQQFVFKKNEL